MKSEEAFPGHEVQKQHFPPPGQLSEVGASQNQSSTGRELQAERGKINFLPSSLSIGVLQEIGRRCSSKVELRSVVSTSEELQFSVEVFFNGEKVGVGMGKTRKDAQQQAAEDALRSLADKYASYIAPRSGAVDRDFDKLSLGSDNGFLWDTIDPGSDELQLQDGLSRENTSEVAQVAVGGTSPNMVDQQVQKRANSPRSLYLNPSKRSKEELLCGSQLPSS